MDNTASIYERIAAVFESFKLDHMDAQRGNKAAAARARKDAKAMTDQLKAYRIASVAENKKS
jgi:hypothetical protein